MYTIKAVIIIRSTEKFDAARMFLTR